MADELFSQALEAVELIITLAIYLGILINIFTRKGSDQLMFVIALVGYFSILFFIQNFFLATIFITMWFVFIGYEFFVSKEILLGLFVLLALLDYSNPLFVLFALVVYVITTANFVFSSFRRIDAGAR